MNKKGARSLRSVPLYHAWTSCMDCNLSMRAINLMQTAINLQELELPESREEFKKFKGRLQLTKFFSICVSSVYTTRSYEAVTPVLL